MVFWKSIESCWTLAEPKAIAEICSRIMIALPKTRFTCLVHIPFRKSTRVAFEITILSVYVSMCTSHLNLSQTIIVKKRDMNRYAVGGNTNAMHF